MLIVYLLIFYIFNLKCKDDDEPYQILKSFIEWRDTIDYEKEIDSCSKKYGRQKNFSKIFYKSTKVDESVIILFKPGFFHVLNYNVILGITNSYTKCFNVSNLPKNRKNLERMARNIVKELLKFNFLRNKDKIYLDFREIFTNLYITKAEFKFIDRLTKKIKKKLSQKTKKEFNIKIVTKLNTYMNHNEFLKRGEEAEPYYIAGYKYDNYIYNHVFSIDEFKLEKSFKYHSLISKSNSNSGKIFGNNSMYFLYFKNVLNNDYIIRRFLNKIAADRTGNFLDLKVEILKAINSTEFDETGYKEYLSHHLKVTSQIANILEETKQIYVKLLSGDSPQDLSALIESDHCLKLVSFYFYFAIRNLRKYDQHLTEKILSVLKEYIHDSLNYIRKVMFLYLKTYLGFSFDNYLLPQEFKFFKNKLLYLKAIDEVGEYEKRCPYVFTYYSDLNEQNNFVLNIYEASLFQSTEIMDFYQNLH